MLQPPPPPAQPSMVLPWLQLPLTPMLWAALALSTIVFIAAVLRTRRSADPFPLSPRWLAVTAILLCALFAALSYGADLTHPAALYATPTFILVSALLARNAWHATDEAQHNRTLAAPLAGASMLVCTALLFFDLTGVSTREHPYGRWEVGLGWGEAVAALLPTLGATLVPLALLPSGHARTAAVRRTVVLLGTSLTLVSAATAAAGAVAMTAPLHVDSAFADRYIYLNAILPVPALLAALCAVGVLLATEGPRRWWVVQAFILFVVAIAAFALVWALSASYNGRTSFEFDRIGPPACLAVGLALGVALAPIGRFGTLVRMLLVSGCLLICALIAGALPNPSGSPFAPLANGTMILIGLLTAGSVFAARTAVPQTPQRDPLAAALVAASLLAGSVAACTLALRAQLTYQAARFGQSFNYESLPNSTPEIRRELQGIPQGIHMRSGGDRWAWVVPKSIWWTRDDAWRDALVLADRTQPRVDDPAMTGAYYGARITGPDRKPSETSFTDAQYVAIIQPAPAGQQKLIVHGITARQATPEQLLSFARFVPTNLRTWLGFALSVPLAMRLSRRTTSTAAAAGFTAALLLLTTPFFGLGAGIALLVCTGIALIFVSLRRDDAWHTPSMLAVLMGTHLALGGLLLHLNDLMRY